MKVECLCSGHPQHMSAIKFAIRTHVIDNSGSEGNLTTAN